jgi:polycystin 1L2
MKVLFLAIFFAFFFQNSNDDKEAKEYIDENQIDLQNDEEYLHSNKIIINRSQTCTNRLTKSEIADARQQRLKEVQMWSMIREILTYFGFLLFLCIIVYSNRDRNSFLQVKHLQKYFFNSRKIDLDYQKILTINDYWKWLNNSFVENLRAQDWYNGDIPRNLSGYINDKSNRLIGWATMRQLRIKSHRCSNQQIISTCQTDYNLFNEEKRSFQPGWLINQTTEKYSLSIQQSFEYKSNDVLDTYVYVGKHESYSGNGYVYEFRGRLSDLRSNISELHKLGWIDNKTRAVFLQISLYNPNVELFTSVTFLIEFLSTGGIYPQSRFQPMNFYGRSF